MLRDGSGGEVANEVPNGIVLGEEVLAFLAVVRERRDGVHDHGLHAHRRLLERDGEDGAHPGVEELLHAILVAEEKTERYGGSLLAIVGAFLQQLDEGQDAILLDDVLGVMGIVAGKGGECGGRATATVPAGGMTLNSAGGAGDVLTGEELDLTLRL